MTMKYIKKEHNRALSKYPNTIEHITALMLNGMCSTTENPYHCHDQFNMEDVWTTKCGPAWVLILVMSVWDFIQSTHLLDSRRQMQMMIYHLSFAITNCWFRCWESTWYEYATSVGDYKQVKIGSWCKKSNSILTRRRTIQMELERLKRLNTSLFYTQSANLIHTCIVQEKHLFLSASFASSLIMSSTTNTVGNIFCFICISKVLEGLMNTFWCYWHGYCE